MSLAFDSESISLHRGRTELIGAALASNLFGLSGYRRPSKTAGAFCLIHSCADGGIDPALLAKEAVQMAFLSLGKKRYVWSRTVCRSGNDLTR